MIRRAEIKDIPEIMKLLGQVLMVHYEIRPDLYKPNSTKYSPDELKDIIRNDGKPIFVYTDEGDKTLGYAFCCVNDYSGIDNLVPIKSVYIDDICVDEACRGRHIATALFEYVKEFAKDLGCHNVTLCVWEGNDSARSFYEKMGMGVQRTIMESVLD